MIKYVQTLTDSQLINLLEDINNELKVRLTVGRKLPLAAPTPIDSRSERQKVIDKAKQAITELKNEQGHYIAAKSAACEAEFHVNIAKGAVVVLLKGFRTKIIRSKGIAKCDPTVDAFNVHIGKAIALYRALGKTVPEEFLNAPQPKNAEVGDFIEYSGKVYKVINNSKEHVAGKTAHISSLAAKNGRVVNDSKE
jgi:hypothetical protein